MTQRSMYRLLMSYLEGLPRAMREKELPSGEKIRECIYSPHSLRATTATLLLDSRSRLSPSRKLDDHKHITTAQTYDKWRPVGARDSALPQGADLRAPARLPMPSYNRP
jgi:integrase